MNKSRHIKNALISVFHKDGLSPIIRKLNELGVNIYSTGGTQKFIEGEGVKVKKIEDLTSYPSILGGRVKTLHPKVFGGILSRRILDDDKIQLEKYNIPEFDLVIVDLYPFEKTVISNAEDQEIIEKIDIGGISLIRAAAKNYNDVLIISAMKQYVDLLKILENNGETTIETRKKFASEAFNISSHYDMKIFKYFNKNKIIEEPFKESINEKKKLRYGENPHQKGTFFGRLDDIFDQLHGKELSYNNLLDVDAAVNLISEFKETTFVVMKHNNACGVASREILVDSWNEALSSDPVSAFGGVIITNQQIDTETAKEINKIFFEVIIAPSYQNEALEILKSKKNRIILVLKNLALDNCQFRSILNGVLFQEKDLHQDKISEMKTVTEKSPSKHEFLDMEFASKISKHTKSNTIVLVKNKKLLASGVGQTSRVDALKQAIIKAKSVNFELSGSIMASDAFFPFPDCVEIASKEGIKCVIQPGGSIKDNLSINYCNENNIAMVMTGYRHFKH
tara:strand:- start:1053 stop:2579 length:1527 start_codon:yes stop_codon:yes gene_type:complete